MTPHMTYTKVSIPRTAHVGSGGVSALLAVPTHVGDSSCKLSVAANSLGSSHPSSLETGHQEGNQGSGITLGSLRGCSGAPRVSHISHHQPARKGSGLPGEDRQAEREGQGLVLWPLVLLGFPVTLPRGVHSTDSSCQEVPCPTIPGAGSCPWGAGVPSGGSSAAQPPRLRAGSCTVLGTPAG